MKKKLKGFTLVELIMVLALVGIIMYSVLQLMDPVSKYFVRSSNFEGSTACVDNLKRAVEGNLKYADRVRAYKNFDPFLDRNSDTPLPSAQLKEHVRNFYDYFFTGRTATDTAGYIYALVLDNTKEDDLSGYPDTKTLNTAGKNAGRIVLYRFWYNTYDSLYDEPEEVGGYGDPASPLYKQSSAERKFPVGNNPPWQPADVTPVENVENWGINGWYVNKQLYQNYEYRFDLGLVEPELDEDGNVKTDINGNPIMSYIGETTGGFVPSNFALTISMTELRKNLNGEGLVREYLTSNTSCSFSMKNVLDATAGYTKSAEDEYLRVKDGKTEEDADFEYEMIQKKRYSNMLPNADSSTYFDGLYFIYTIPQTTYTNPTGYNSHNQLGQDS